LLLYIYRLERTYIQCPSYDIKIITGDYNAKAGNESWTKRVVGGHSLHDESNDNGEQLIKFVVQQRMMIGGKLKSIIFITTAVKTSNPTGGKSFPHKSIHKRTWRSPDRRTINQVDHVLTNQLQGTNLLDVQSFIGANADNDHYLILIAWLRG
jgi:hypothetical protein